MQVDFPSWIILTVRSQFILLWLRLSSSLLGPKTTGTASSLFVTLQRISGRNSMTVKNIKLLLAGLIIKLVKVYPWRNKCNFHGSLLENIFFFQRIWIRRAAFENWLSASKKRSPKSIYKQQLKTFANQRKQK